MNTGKLGTILQTFWSEPWRNFERNGGWTKKYRDILLEEIKSFNHLDIEPARIVLFGAISSGQTSFLNSIACIDFRRMVDKFTAGAWGDRGFTQTINRYLPKGLSKKFVLLDIPEKQGLDMLHIDNIKCIITGFEPVDFKFKDSEVDDSHVDSSDKIEEMFCEFCKKKGISHTAEGFCVDCVEYFCSSCIESHSYFLPTHVLKDKTSMPQDVCLKPCLTHSGEIIKFYCSACELFLCSLCRQNDHGKCTNVAHLPILVQDINITQALNKVNAKLRNTLKAVEKRESKLKEKAQIAREYAEKAKQLLHLKRTLVLKWLNTNVYNIEKEIDTIQNADEKALLSGGSVLSVIKDQSNTLKTRLDNKSLLSKRCEMFMILKETESQQKQIDERIRQVEDYNVTCYEFESSEDTMRRLEVKSLGSLEKKLSKTKYEANEIDSRKMYVKTLNSRRYFNTVCSCVVIVVDAMTIYTDSITDEHMKKIENLQRLAQDLDVRTVLLLTKIDCACPELKNDLKKVFHSRRMKEIVMMAERKLGIPIWNIFPVQNYSYQVDLDLNMDILLLLALRQMVRFAYDGID